MAKHVDLLERLRSFSVNTCPVSLIGNEESKRVPAHRLMVQPLVDAAVEIRIFSMPKESEIRKLIEPIVLDQQGSIKLDLNKEVVQGFEALWNATSWRRGAIAIRLKASELNWEALLKYCAGPHVWAATAERRKVIPDAAVRWCNDFTRAPGRVAACFSASNGIQGLELFAAPEKLFPLYRLAEKNCRTFKRQIESNGTPDEIIYDRPPYSVFL
jgi:hypothetical protein